MAELTHKDQERFLASVGIAAVLHLVLFTGLHFFLNIKPELPPEYAGPLYLEIGNEFEQEITRREIIQEKEKKQEEKTVPDVKQDKKEKQTKDDSASIVKRDDSENKNRDVKQTEPEINPVKDDADSYPANEKEAEDTQAGKEDGVPDKTPQPTPGLTPTPYDPALEEDNLAELDRLLEEGSSGKTDPDKEGSTDTGKTKKDDATSEESGGPHIEWEDSRDRKPVTTFEPVIPDWVSRQGLKLRVKVSFLLTPDGFLTSLSVMESSGHTDVDNSIIEALRKWRFPPVSGTKNIRGEITYVIGLR
ncbi:MAG: TonB family protein [Spirochaetales bacterium]|nr:TonB family protein [Spirochaetales bacterium]